MFKAVETREEYIYKKAVEAALRKVVMICMVWFHTAAFQVLCFL